MVISHIDVSLIYTLVMENSGQLHSNTDEVAVQPETKQEFVPAAATALPKKRTFPIGQSTGHSIVGLKRYLRWLAYLKYILFPAVILLVIGGSLFWIFYVNGMETKSSTVGGFTYSFSYFRSASSTLNSNGMRGFAKDYDHTAVVGPVSNTSQLCMGSSSQYTLAFTVHVNGDSRPVCKSQDAQGNQIYALSFASQNHFHEFVITSGDTPNPNEYPKLQSIFESIRVSQ
jgi:hypothetical protein